MRQFLTRLAYLAALLFVLLLGAILAGIALPAAPVVSYVALVNNDALTTLTDTRARIHHPLHRPTQTGPLFSPDSAWMLYLEDPPPDNAVLHITDRYGKPHTRIDLPIPQMVSLRDITWSPDGAYIAITLPNADGFIYTRSGEEAMRLTTSANSTRVDWSPDGAYAAVIDCEQGAMNCGVRFVSVRGDADPPQVFANATWSNVLATRWSPDSTTYSFAVGFVTRGEQQFHVVDVTSSGVESLALRRATREYVPCQWAQDGQRVLCVTETAVLLLDIVTGEETRLSETENFLPQNANWQPGGELLLTWYGADGLAQQLGVYRDGDIAPIDTYAGLLRAASWTPDGERALLEIMNRGQRDLFLLDADLTLRQLTEQGVTNRAAQWSPDGTHMLFTSDRTGVSGTYIMAIDTGGVRRVSPPGIDTCCAAWR